MTTRVLVALVATALLAGAATVASQFRPTGKAAGGPTPGSSLGDLPNQSAPARATFATVSRSVPPHRTDSAQPAVDAGALTYHGMPVTVSCGTCHATVPTNREHGLADVLPTKFHAGLQYQHGGLSCVSCHNADNYDTLRLADGRSVPFANAEQLCAQCHGPQTRDYLNGSHGGMTGYWDRRKGERQRNTCTDCHDPHVPAYPVLQPVFQPRDRGALQQAAREAAANARAGAPANTTATSPAAPNQSPTP